MRRQESRLSDLPQGLGIPSNAASTNVTSDFRRRRTFPLPKILWACLGETDTNSRQLLCRFDLLDIVEDAGPPEFLAYRDLRIQVLFDTETEENAGNRCIICV